MDPPSGLDVPHWVQGDHSIRTVLPLVTPLSSAEQSECNLVLYGHTARVWDARLLPEVIVSIGEDATCRLWDYSGRAVGEVKGHKGRSIWSLAVDSGNKLVVSTFAGGSPQADQRWPLRQLGAGTAA